MHDPFVTECAFRDRFGYTHKRLHWAWHRQWFLAFAIRHRARNAMRVVYQPCFATEGDVAWGQKIARELGLM